MATTLYEKLISTESLAPLPAVASRLVRLANDPDVQIEELASVIEQDPPLTAKVLGIANSAFYSPRMPVLTVRDAIIRVIGLRMVANLSFGLALGGGFDTTACKRFDLTRYWLQALGTADLASGLVRAAALPDKPDPDVAYLVGLLHNIGELLLVHLAPQEMSEVLADADSLTAAELVQRERELLGTDRWEAGALLMRHWELPAVVADSIAQFNDAGNGQACTAMVRLLRAARNWIDGAILGRTETLHVVDVDEAYCEYRSNAFHENYASLKLLAGSLSH
ncbi:MAG: HDOD domain-containing protein [Gammaproteobacteria bacterium]|nr:HDOD domain-containing protein [Gammaproteobacteria bacterium]